MTTQRCFNAYLLQGEGRSNKIRNKTTDIEAGKQYKEQSGQLNQSKEALRPQKVQSYNMCHIANIGIDPIPSKYRDSIVDTNIDTDTFNL